MKKITIIALAIMLAAVFTVSSSAAIYYSDSFDGTELDPRRWIVEGNNFFIDDSTGAMAAYSDGAVCQMEFRYYMTPTPGIFPEFASSVRVQFRDYDREEGTHSASLWWRDNFCELSEEDEEWGLEWNDVSHVYMLNVSPDDNTVSITKSDVEDPIAMANLADHGITIEVGEKQSTWFLLGWRITRGHISAYVNNKKILDVDDPDIIITSPDNPMLTKKGYSGSPILIFNNGMYVAFDDFVVATPDTDLFGEGTVEPTPTASTEPVTSVQSSVSEVVVTVTNEKGEVETDENGEVKTEVSEVIVTEVVTVAPAETQNNGGGGNAANTGDAALIVLAVMAVSLGAALVIKKISVR